MNTIIGLQPTRMALYTVVASRETPIDETRIHRGPPMTYAAANALAARWRAEGWTNAEPARLTWVQR